MKYDLTKEPVENTYIYHRHKNLNKSGIHYSLLLILIITFLIAMPWIQVESVTTSPGIVVPHTGPVSIKVVSGGKLNLAFIENDLYVHLGDTLFSIWMDRFNKEAFTLAPLNGYIQKPLDVKDQSIVEVGETILEIYPDPEFYVKSYLSADEITSLFPDQQVEFEVRSSKSNSKISLTGWIREILPPTNRFNDKDLFEVRCSMDPFEQNRNGPHLNNGTPLLTRFRLARRTAFDIILKDVEANEDGQL